MVEKFSAWLGRSETSRDILEPARLNALQATLGNAASLLPGDPLPLLRHWLYFWNIVPPAGRGADGHPARGDFLPPVILPRRMWGGGRLTFISPLRVGEVVTRVSTIVKVETKLGRSGQLVIVTIKHELTAGRGLAIVEEQDIVYREAPPGYVAKAAVSELPPADTPWRRKVLPDAVLLFSYSALTMNGHRIHYDRDYAMNEEGYPALVVHGPLQAMLLADLATRNFDAPIAAFDFRGQAPAFDGVTLHLRGEPTIAGATLWSEQNGDKKMIATIAYGKSV